MKWVGVRSTPLSTSFPHPLTSFPRRRESDAPHHSLASGANSDVMEWDIQGRASLPRVWGELHLPNAAGAVKLSGGYSCDAVLRKIDAHETPVVE